MTSYMDLDGGLVPRELGSDPYGYSSDEYDSELDESFDEYGSSGADSQGAYVDRDSRVSGGRRRAALPSSYPTDSENDEKGASLSRHVQMGCAASRTDGAANQRVHRGHPRRSRGQRRDLGQRVTGARVEVGARQRVVSSAVVGVGRPQPVVSGARVDVTGGPRGKLVRVITTASGIDRKVEVAGRNAEKVTRKTERLFSETKGLIREHLVTTRQLGARHTVHDVSLSINYTSMEVTWKGPDGEHHKLDLSTKTELHNGAQIHKKMEETLKLNQDYTPSGAGKLHEYAGGLQGPISGRGAFSTSVGLGTTFSQFAKDDLLKLTGQLNTGQALRVVTQMSTADMYHRGMDRKLVAIVNDLSGELSTRKSHGEVSDRTRELQHNISLLKKRLRMLQGISREAVYYITTQGHNVGSAPNAVMGAQSVSRAARAYLMNQKKVTTSRSLLSPSSWARGKAREFTPAQNGFIEGLGAMIIPIRDAAGAMNHREFNDFTRQQHLGSGFTTGLERGFLFENMALHDQEPGVAGDLLRPVGQEFFTEGLQGHVVSACIVAGLLDIQVETVALHQEINLVTATATLSPEQAIDRAATLLEHHIGQIA